MARWDAVPGGARRGVYEGRPRAGLSHAKVAKPAYPPWPHFACPPEGLAGGRAPSDPRNGNGPP